MSTDNQGGLWDTIIEHDALAELLKTRATVKAEHSKFLSAERKIKAIIEKEPQFKELAGQRIRVGDSAFDVLDDPGGIESPSSVSAARVKPRKIAEV